MGLDFDTCYRALRSRDARFDGRFFTAVTSTRVYCRPTCPARTPLAANVVFFPNAAAAEGAGFRACRRCRPELSPAAPDWDVRADLVGRALRLIADGVVDEAGVAGLAARLAVGPRHLRRLFLAELGVGPASVARSSRARLARQLVDETDLTLTRVAFAAGFTSLRQFNATMKAVFGLPPSELRRRPASPASAAHARPASAAALAGGRAHAGLSSSSRASPELTLRLSYRPPLAGAELLDYLAARAIPGVEQVDGACYRRTLTTGAGPATLEVTLLAGGVGAGGVGAGGVGAGEVGAGEVGADRVGALPEVKLRVTAPDPCRLAAVVRAVRRLFDLDADPQAVAGELAADPLLAPLVAARPGLRLPGAHDGFELAVRAVLGQQVTLAGAVTLLGRLVTAVGRPLPEPSGPLTHLFPTADAVAEANLDRLGVPRSRTESLRALARAVSDRALTLDGSGDPEATVAQLLALPGVGPWTAAYIAMRALRDPDAFPQGDRGLQRSAERLGLPSGPKALLARAERWRPWRGYAAMHLWTHEAAHRAHDSEELHP